MENLTNLHANVNFKIRRVAINEGTFKSSGFHRFVLFNLNRNARVILSTHTDAK